MANENAIKQGEKVREEVLQAMINYIQQHGYPPTFSEIGDMVGFKSNSSVKNHIDIMLDKGMIETDTDRTGKPRAIRIPGYKFVKEEILRKLTPKEVHIQQFGDGDEFIKCPTCGRSYFAEDWGIIKFCPNCGQAIIVKEESHG